MKNGHEFTYRLLVRSEEMGWSLVETIVYALLGLSVMVSILQFVLQQDRVPVELTSQAYEAPCLSQQTVPIVDRKS